MNTILRKLANECYETDTNYFYKKIGNYAVKRNDYIIVHYYYGYPICKVYIIGKTFYLDCCGFRGYKLTTAQLNYLEKFYKDKNYILKGRK